MADDFCRNPAPETLRSHSDCYLILMGAKTTLGLLGVRGELVYSQLNFRAMVLLPTFEFILLECVHLDRINYFE